MGCDGTGIPPAWGTDSRVWNLTTVYYPINQAGLQTGAGSGGCDGEPNYTFTSAHTSGVNLLYCDGSVSFTASSTALLVLQQVASRADGSAVVHP